MDLVSRLKQFMDQSDIAISQFADTCNIPRPTMSQILNGRNKKISDELIAKIHLAYPKLSVLWLMFGEGDMVASSNIQFSEPQIDRNGDNLQAQNADFMQHNAQKFAQFTAPENSPKNFGTEQTSQIAYKSNASTQITTDIEHNLFNSNDDDNAPLLSNNVIEFEQPANLQANVEDETNSTQNSPESNIPQGDQPTAANVQSLNGIQSISLPTMPNKQITNIVVFYSDNSFQSFHPTTM